VSRTSFELHLVVLGGRRDCAKRQTVIELANEVFGFNGWSSSVISLKMDYVRYRHVCGPSALPYTSAMLRPGR
jgi:hypothetical protein